MRAGATVKQYSGRNGSHLPLCGSRFGSSGCQTEDIRQRHHSQHPQISTFVPLPQLQPPVLGTCPCPRARSSRDNVGCVVRGRGLAALPVPGSHLHAQARWRIVPDARKVAPTSPPRQRGPGADPVLALLKIGMHFLCAPSWILLFATLRGHAVARVVLPGRSTGAGSAQVIPALFCPCF